MVEYSGARLLNKCMYAVTICFFTFPISKELYIFLKKKKTMTFYVIPRTIYLYKISSRGWCLLGLSLVKKFSYERADFCVMENISVKNIMMSCYWHYFCIFYIFHFFQIRMVSFFLAWHDRYFIMLKVRAFSNLPILL